MRCPHCHTEIEHGVSKCPMCTGNLSYDTIVSGHTIMRLGKYTAPLGALLFMYFNYSLGLFDSPMSYVISGIVGAVFGFSVPGIPNALMPAKKD